jgi:hypothetical protein
MLGRKWTDVEKKAYRSAFTIGRIVDEVWILVGIGWFVLFAILMTRVPFGVGAMAYLLGFAALGVMSYRLLPGLLKRTMPPELRSSLPDGRFDGPSSPSAPRTYRELFRRWLTRA